MSRKTKVRSSHFSRKISLIFIRGNDGILYLNVVVDQWFLQNYDNYNNIIVRYTDDTVFFFKKENDAKDFMLQLKRRVEAFGLSLNRDKTKTIDFDKTE